MKKFTFSGLVAALALLFVMVAPQLKGQENAAPQQAPQQQAQQAQPQPDAKAFMGTIVKDGDRLVLKDMASNLTYQLDDQKKAKKYEGKPVKVTGSLDSSSNTIHVENIETAS